MAPTRRELLIGALALVIAPTASLMAHSPSSASFTDTYSLLQADLDGWTQSVDLNVMTDPALNSKYDQFGALVNRARQLYSTNAPIPTGSNPDPIADLRADAEFGAWASAITTDYTFDVVDPQLEPTTTTSNASANAVVVVPSPVPAPVLPAMTAMGASDFIQGVLGVLVGQGAWEAVQEVLNTNYPAIMQALADAIQSGNKGAILAALGNLIRTLVSPAFLRALIREMGEAVAKKIVGKIIAKAIPWLGWALIIGEILIWIYKELTKKKKAMTASTNPSNGPALFSMNQNAFGLPLGTA